jgi:hypothetical protein
MYFLWNGFLWNGFSKKWSGSPRKSISVGFFQLDFNLMKKVLKDKITSRELEHLRSKRSDLRRSKWKFLTFVIYSQRLEQQQIDNEPGKWNNSKINSDDEKCTADVWCVRICLAFRSGWLSAASEHPLVYTQISSALQMYVRTHNY